MTSKMAWSYITELTGDELVQKPLLETRIFNSKKISLPLDISDFNLTTLNNTILDPKLWDWKWKLESITNTIPTYNLKWECIPFNKLPNRSSFSLRISIFT